MAHCEKGLLSYGAKTACLFVFDILMLNGEDLRQMPLDERRMRLERLLHRAPDALRFSDHMEEKDGAAMFRHACRMGLEGIVSKRRNRPYQSGRSRTWLKVKNPAYLRRGA